MKTVNKTLAKIFAQFIVLIFCMSNVGCKKLLEVNPPDNQIVGKEIYNNNTTAISVLTGIYVDMVKSGRFSDRNSISVLTALAGDELQTISEPNDILTLVYTNNLTNNGEQLFWPDLYAFVFRINSAIEGISQSANISTEVKSRLIGEAKFFRAFMYYYLVNLYGDVPLLTSTDVKVNFSAPRTAMSDVYNQIVADLKDAQSLLPENYLSGNLTSGSNFRVRPNKYVATSLLARVYLYMKKWDLAVQESTKVIDNPTYKLEDLDKVFLNTSKEAIWQLQPVDPFKKNTFDAALFVLKVNADYLYPGPDAYSRPVFLSERLMEEFYTDDKRRLVWTDTAQVRDQSSGNILGIYPFANKYRQAESSSPRTEFLMVFRLAEQYLIRAEAKTEQGDLQGALSDLNVVHNRSVDVQLSSTNKDDLVNLILKEYQLEFFTEFGHRWFNMKRLGKIDEIMNNVSPVKGDGGTWMPYKALFPIPIADIQRNPNLKGHQNPGYPEN